MNKRLYVGNLAFSTTQRTLREVFSEVGQVVSADLITDRMTGRSRGFGFVEMVNEAAARQAVSELNGKLVDGREIKVNEARPRRRREYYAASDSRW